MSKLGNLSPLMTLMLFFKVRTKKLYRCLKLTLIQFKASVIMSFNAGYDAPFINSATVGGTSVGAWIGMAIGVMISVLMLPPVADTVIGVNTSSWTFTGADACKTMMYLIPMVYVAGVVTKIVRTAIGR